MIVEPTTDIAEIKSVLSNSLLSKVSGTNAEPDMSFTYVAIRHQNTLIGLYKVRPITDRMAEVHVLVLPDNWGTQLSLEAAHQGFQFLIDHTQFRKVICYVPTDCIHVLHYTTKLGYKAIGYSSKACTYNEKLTDLVILEKDL